MSEKAKATYDKLLKERDFHKMHHQRVVQEKNRLVSEIKRLKKLYVSVWAGEGVDVCTSVLAQALRACGLIVAPGYQLALCWQPVAACCWRAPL